MNNLIINNVLRENVKSLSAYNSVKAIVIVRSNSTQAKKNLATPGDFFDMETEVSLTKTIQCSILALKYLAKVTALKDKSYVDSMILTPEIKWDTDESLLKFREKYSNDKIYKFEEGCDLLLYIPSIVQFRHLFCKGALASSVDGMLTSACQSEKLAYIELTTHQKGTSEREWFYISSKWIRDNVDSLSAVDIVSENFYKIIDNSDVPEEVEEVSKKKKAR